MATKVLGDKDDNGKGSKSDGNGNKGGKQAMKRVTARAGRAITMAMRMAGDKEGFGKGNNSNGNSKEGGRGETATMAMVTASTRVMAMATRRWWARDGDNGQGSKGNSSGHEDGGRQRGQWQG